ncbi:MAG TPA: DUF1801 domain-containing protein [Flavisolibacter sp.]
MATNKISFQQYLDKLPDDRKDAISEIRKIMKSNLPKGFAENISENFLSYNVPHSLYPDGYHCNPDQPLPFVSFASQKNFIAMYHMGLYSDPELLKWFTNEYRKHSTTKLDMGKSCVRFKKTADIPFELLKQLASKLSPAQWIKTYESHIKK